MAGASSSLALGKSISLLGVSSREEMILETQMELVGGGRIVLWLAQAPRSRIVVLLSDTFEEDVRRRLESLFRLIYSNELQ